MEIKQFKIPKNMTEGFKKDLIEQIEDEIKKIKFEIVKLVKSLKPNEGLKSYFEDKTKELEEKLKTLKPKSKETKETKETKENLKPKTKENLKSKAKETKETKETKTLIDSIKKFIN